MEILNVDSKFPYERIILGSPQAIQGGSYFAKLSLDNDGPVCLQLPKCMMKQGIVHTKKGKYCDLMYERENSEALVEWIEDLELTLQERISEKKDLWFHSDLTDDDIESMMTPISRSYKSGKKILIRTYLETNKRTGEDKCIIYDEHEDILSLDDVEANKNLVPLIQLSGIRFTARSFELEIKLAQIMLLQKKPSLTDGCLIKHNIKNNASLLENKKNVYLEETLKEETLKKDQPLQEQPLQEEPLQEEPLQEEPLQEQPLQEQPLQEEAATVENPIKSEYEESVNNDDEQIKENTNNLNENNIKLTKNVDGLDEVDFNFDDINDSISLKKPDEVYYEIYRAARIKAKKMRQAAVEAYLEAKNIKTRYMLQEIDSSDEEDLELYNEDDSVAI